MKLKSAVLFGLTLFFAANLYLSAAVAGGQNNIVFQLGNFNRSSMEFAGGLPDKPVNFTMGQSSPAKDWYATQPVVTASASTEKNLANGSAPWAIHFDLKRAPAAVYRLHVALLIETASVPALRVTINGKNGIFYLHPSLDWTSGDQTGAFSPVYSHADVAFAFPGSYLQPGVNTITLQAIEQAETHIPGAGLTYDAIELDRVSGSFHPQASSVQIQPTIFYQSHNGELDEIVDVFVRFHGDAKPGGNVELAIGGRRYGRPIQATHDFGEEKFEFAVPEFPAHTRAQLLWNINGHRDRQEETIDPAKKWTLFLVPHIHLDIGYTDYQAKVAAVQSRVIDEALNLTAEHPDFRFSLDGMWPLEQFLKTRTPAEQKRAIAAIENRQLFLPAQYANLLTGFPTAETLIRSLYASANFSRLHGTPFNYANITDVPSFSWSYASILAAAGIHELFSGSNNYRAPVLLQGRLNTNSPMWWEGPDGQKVLLWYSRHYMQMQFMFGLPPLPAAGHRDTSVIFAAIRATHLSR